MGICDEERGLLETSPLVRLPLPPLLSHLTLPLALYTPVEMEFYPNAVYPPSSFQDFASYQDPEEVTQAPAINPWEKTEFIQNDWDTHLSVGPHVESAAPHLIEVPQVPQIPPLHALPEPLSHFSAQRLVNLPEFEYRIYMANHWQ